MQKAPFLISCACLSAIALTACSHPAPTTQAQVVAPRCPMIVRLESRNYSIVISAGPKSAVYSITNAGGETLVDNVSLHDLHALHPDLYQILAPALAPNAAASAQESAPVQDASIDSF